MVTRKIELKNPERFEGEYKISKTKLGNAIIKATDKLRENITKFGDKFPLDDSVNFVYPLADNNNWGCGMYTGLYWLAYELTGDKVFREAAENQVKFHRERIKNRYNFYDHDVGFVVTPSCVAGYKLTGNEEMKKSALDIAEFFYNYSYSKKGGFILRCASHADEEGGCRTMMDTLMNIPLLFWAGEMTGDKKYTEAAISQYKITEKCLIRDDASSYHHYSFDVKTHEPVRGVTLQGHSDESCWSRGHSWGVYGFPIAYSYTHDESLIELHKNVTYFMLNHLPDDLVPYWDYDFVSGEEARDSSAGAVAVCGMHEMCRHLPDDAPQKKIFENASAQMLEALIDKCTESPVKETDGILFKVTGSVPHNCCIEECAMYGDYPYLEALMRFANSEWKMYW